MKVNAANNTRAQLLPGRPAHLVASAPHSSGWSAGSAWCSGCQTRSKLNIRTYKISFQNKVYIMVKIRQSLWRVCVCALVSPLTHPCRAQSACCSKCPIPSNHLISTLFLHKSIFSSEYL